MPEDTNIPKLAFLGPPGSHSYQCALNRFGSSVEYVDRQTITDVFDAVSHDVPIALIPQENSIYGIVTETYDLLRRPDVGKDKLVRGEVTIAVQHCLLVRCGVKLENVRRILSHEQALGQCAQFLSEKLPAAARVKVSSTSAAAQSLLSSADECDSAAICSSSCASLFDGLEVLYENIQDKDTNLTRFYIIAHSSIVDLPSAPLEVLPRRALVRLSLNPPESDSSSRRNKSLHLIISTLLTTFGLPATRIDRRPSLNDMPFEDVFFVELEDTGSPSSSPPNSGSDHTHTAWLSRVKAGIERIEAIGGVAVILGEW